VGIGTTTPAHTLDVAGDVAAIAFVNTSTRSAKKDIAYATASSTSDMLDQLVNLKVATYRYTLEEEHDPLVSASSPKTRYHRPEILSADGKGVDIYKLATSPSPASRRSPPSWKPRTPASPRLKRAWPR